MPTSYGLSYWIHSLPRSACPTGDFTRSANCITSPCAPAVPLPQNSVTRSAESIIRTRASISASPGRTVGREVTRAVSRAFSGAGSEAMSPGSETTLTPLWPTACWIAVCSSRGICFGFEISSL
ncbi:hypothetical protein GCM10019017_70650 [Streptomyces showdoensis]